MYEFNEGDQVVLLYAFENKHKGRVEVGTKGTVLGQQGRTVRVAINDDEWLFWTHEIKKIEYRY